MIDYSPLWNTLKSKGINQYRLIRSYHFSSGQLHRIRKNEHVSTPLCVRIVVSER